MIFFTKLIFQVFRPRTPSDAIDLVGLLLEYTPCRRISPLEACAHQFFDELREPGKTLPNQRELPPLFNFTAQGMIKKNSLTNVIFMGENVPVMIL